MVQNSNTLPEGTDTIVEGASESSGLPRGDAGVPGSADPGADVGTDALITDTTTGSNPPAAGTGAASSGTFGDRLRGGREQLSGQASEKVHGIVGQGLERSSEALANISRMIGDTAAGIDERLGQEYGDYARRAAASIEDAANSLASKNPEDLIEDTRDFVRKSPGVALAGAAVIGFALTRLVKNGLSSSRDEDEDGPRRTTSAD